MKRIKIILLVFLLFLLSGCSNSNASVVRNVKWNMSMEDVNRAEEGKCYQWDDEFSMIDSAEWNGFPCNIVYRFEENKLNEITFLFEDISDTKFGRIYDATIKEMGNEGTVLESFESDVLPLLKVEWKTNNSVLLLVYCDGTSQVQKSASLMYSPIK